jgi:hypothetical protein
MNEVKKPLVNMQVKVPAELFEAFELEYSNSDCKTKGQFMELIWENFQNPKTKEVPRKEDQDKITELEGIISAQQQELTQAAEKIQDIPPGAIMLNFPESNRKEIWSVLQCAKRAKWAENYEELIGKMFQALRARGEMILDEEDRKYVETLPYE